MVGGRVAPKRTVGVVGVGEVANKVHLPVLHALRNEVSVSYVADTSDVAVAKTSAAFRCEPFRLRGNSAVLPPTDIVLITTPVGSRADYYELFAERGTAVLAEKPATLTSADLGRLQEMYPAERFAVGFQRRTYLTSALLKRLVESQLLGRVLRVSAKEGARTTKAGSSQRFMDDIGLSGGGILMDLGCHSIDLALTVTDSATAGPIEIASVFDGDIDREIDLRTRLHPSGGPVELDVSLSWLADRDGTFRVDFENGQAVVGTQPGSPVLIESASGEPVGELSKSEGSPVGAVTIHQACYLVWRSFLDGLNGTAEPTLTLASVAPTVELIEDSYRAVRSTR